MIDLQDKKNAKLYIFVLIYIGSLSIVIYYFIILKLHINLQTQWDTFKRLSTDLIFKCTTMMLHEMQSIQNSQFSNYTISNQ